MILASILFGILTGIVGFAAALVAGHGLLMALGLYVLGGMGGVILTLALLGLRGLVRPARVGRADGLVAVRG
jgi:hypothetical protein